MQQLNTVLPNNNAIATICTSLIIFKVFSKFHKSSFRFMESIAKTAWNQNWFWLDFDWLLIYVVLQYISICGLRSTCGHCLLVVDHSVCILDVDALSKQTKKIDEARQLYERLVTQFPNSGRFWKLYIEQEVLWCFMILLVLNYHSLHCQLFKCSYNGAI